MSRFTTGLMTGGILAAVGLSWMASDSKTRKRVAKDSRRAMRKAGDFFSDVTDKF